MSITDELRKWKGNINTYLSPEVVLQLRCELNAIADRIDAEHQKAEDAEDAVEFADRLCRASERREDVTLWGVDYMPLPVDADGVPIHVGDVMENIFCPPVHREVTGVGVECFYGWDDGNGRYSQFGVSCYRHHHEPTVEDVLDEFFGKANLPDGTQTRAEIIAEFAAKLRLAGDE